MNFEKAIVGCILGTAVGDALGLPYEGLSARRAEKLLGRPDRHRLLFGRGMVSDDTEHTIFIARSLAVSDFRPDQFEKELAKSFRWWLLGMPAGVGFATLRAVIKLWFGISPHRSGVFSAGNGPAMRSAVLGIVFGDDHAVLSEWVLRSTRITHSDPKAFYGALTVALAAHWSSRSKIILRQEYIDLVNNAFGKVDDAEFVDLLTKAARSAQENKSVGVFANSIGSPNGISGYIYHTVPCVIQTWLRYQDDFEGGIQEIIGAGGDTDTTAAILGAIIGARTGKDGIPALWQDCISEWPRSISWMEQLARSLAKSVGGGIKTQYPSYFKPGILPRNLIFLIIVLLHGLRRLAPPY